MREIDTLCENEAERLASASNPVRRGSLWYCPRTEQLWQVAHVWGLAHGAIIEITSFAFANPPARIALLRRREGLQEFSEKYLYFGDANREGI